MKLIMILNHRHTHYDEITIPMILLPHTVTGHI